MLLCRACSRHAKNNDVYSQEVGRDSRPIIGVHVGLYLIAHSILFSWAQSAHERVAVVIFHARLYFLRSEGNDRSVDVDRTDSVCLFRHITRQNGYIYQTGPNLGSCLAPTSN